MSTVVIIVAVLVFSIWFGFMLGFSRAMREAARQMHGPKRSAIPWIFAIIGGIAVLVSVITAAHSCYFVSHAVRTNGVITEMRERIDKDDGGKSYAPTYSFRDASGSEHTVSSDLHSYPPAHQVGDEIRVVYRPSHPEGARIDSFAYVWGLPATTGGIGLVFLPLGVALLYWRRRLTQKSSEQTAL